MSTLPKPIEDEIQKLIQEVYALHDFSKASQIAERAEYEINVLLAITDKGRDLYGFYWQKNTTIQQEKLRKKIVNVLCEIYLASGNWRFHNSISRVSFIKEKEIRPLWLERKRIEQKMSNPDKKGLVPLVRKKVTHILRSFIG